MYLGALSPDKQATLLVKYKEISDRQKQNPSEIEFEDQDEATFKSEYAKLISIFRDFKINLIGRIYFLAKCTLLIIRAVEAVYRLYVI